MLENNIIVLHSKKIAHLDLKPQNILHGTKENPCAIKITGKIWGNGKCIRDDTLALLWDFGENSFCKFTNFLLRFIGHWSFLTFKSCRKLVLLLHKCPHQSMLSDKRWYNICYALNSKLTWKPGIIEWTPGRMTLPYAARERIKQKGTIKSDIYGFHLFLLGNSKIIPVWAERNILGFH